MLSTARAVINFPSVPRATTPRLRGAVRAMAEGHLQAQRRHQLMQLRTLGELRTAHASQPLVALLIDAARLHADTELRLLELAEAHVAQLSAGAAEQPLPAVRLSRRSQGIA